MMQQKQVRMLLIGLLAAFLIMEGTGFYLGTRESWSAFVNRDSKETAKDIRRLASRNKALKNRIAAAVPGGVYIVVDTARNRLFLKRGLSTIREAVISSGSGNVLSAPTGRRQWVFDTPRGTFRVESKHIDPVWTKPDWAFFEEGEQLPSSAKERKEEGVMGDYSLGFGNGYFIHGTLYTRLLGRNVTHGCIRVGDEDLKAVFSVAGIGTKIFIF